MRLMKVLKFAMLTLSIMVLTVTGCSTMHPAMTLQQLKDNPPSPETLVPGDVLDVRFFYTPKLNANEMVQPDGTITLQLIGQVKAQGKTPEELQRDLIKLYAAQLRKPDIQVIVKDRNDRKVYVSGEVKNPGVIKMPGELTLLEAIKQAGGFNRTSADLKNVLIVRQVNGKQSGALVNMKKVLSGEEEKVVYLQPRDVIYIPPKGITKANDWIEKHVNSMLPRIPLGVGITP
jgi:polysaccharide biosynthesis/export protein PslD